MCVVVASRGVVRDGQRMGQLFDHPTRLSGLATRAVALGRRTDVYVGCAPRTRRHGGRNAVQRAFVLWVDCDGDDAVDALREFDPQPSIVIASGTGSNRHPYWPLTADGSSELFRPTMSAVSSSGRRPEYIHSLEGNRCEVGLGGAGSASRLPRR